VSAGRSGVPCAHRGAGLHRHLGDGAMTGERRVAISYTHRLLVQRHGHLFHLDISRPDKGLKVQFAYGG
jgi:hypothetical protein